MASFAELPSELCQQVLAYLTQPDLYSISQVSRSLYDLSISLLYRHVDLLISPGDRVLRIDKFLFNLLKDEKRAKYVKTLRVGLSPKEGTRGGPRLLPDDLETLAPFELEKVLDVLDQEPLVSTAENLREAISSRDYGAYAALLLLTLPSLYRLDMADHEDSTLRLLHNVLRKLPKETGSLGRPSQVLNDRILSIKEVSYNFDGKSELQYPGNRSSVNLWEVLDLPGVQKVEFFVPDGKVLRILEPLGRHNLGHPLPAGLSRTNITTMIIRHANSISQCLRSLLEGTPHLQSLTCELWWDPNKCIQAGNRAAFGNNRPWIPLSQWSEDLKLVKHTLKTLVLSVEFCNCQELFFKQPDPRKHITGYLDLRALETLHTLEVPVPFISGDPDFSIAVSFEPCLPLSLRHLTLRTDLSRAQFPFPFDTSILPQGLSFKDSMEESNYLMTARMDIAYLFQTCLFLLDQLYHLQSITVWQPPDRTLNWFDGQLDDFAITCRNKAVAAKVLYPLMFRWKAAEYWDLVEEVTLFDPAHPESGRFKQLFRGERAGSVPLGLATQYHLGEFHNKHVRRHW